MRRSTTSPPPSACGPDDAHFRYARGKIHGFLNDTTPRSPTCEAALARRTDDPTVPESLARCCNNRAWELATGPAPRRDLERALALSRRALDLAPGEGQ